ncbi:MAG: DUF481 domain-containing protein, partial [Gammaproteobacteria bacterium]
VLGLALAGWLGAAGAWAAPSWEGEVELGLVSTGGNTQTQTLNLKAKARRDGDLWSQAGRLEALNASQDGATSAERYGLQLQLRRGLGGGYLFGLVDALADRFAGLTELYSETVGAGRPLYRGERLKAEGELGLGARQTRRQGEGRLRQEGVLRGALKAGYALSATASLGEDLAVEGGKEATVLRSLTSLTARLLGALSMRLSLGVTHISQVPAGSKRTDHETAVTLVYGF